MDTNSLTGWQPGTAVNDSRHRLIKPKKGVRIFLGLVSDCDRWWHDEDTGHSKAIFISITLGPGSVFEKGTV